MTETVQRKRSRIDDVVAIDLEDTVNFLPTPSSQSIRSYANKLKNVVDSVMAEEDCVYSTGKHGRNVTFSQRVHSVLDSEWKHAVVIKLLGKPNSVNTFDWLRRKWLTKGGWQLVDLPYDFFIVKFNLEEDMNAVLCGGPWIIAGQTLIVRKWSSNFDPETEVIGKMALSVRISGLPVKYFKQYAMERIGGILGEVVKVDQVTLGQARGKFARIFVEVDLRKPLIPFVEVESVAYSVVYEGISMICFECGCYGHAKDKCPSRIVKNDVVDQEVKETSNVESQSDMKINQNNVEVVKEDMGPWMLMNYRNKKKVGDGSSVKKNVVKSSRFSILQEEDNFDNIESANVSESFEKVVTPPIVNLWTSFQEKMKTGKAKRNKVGIPASSCVALVEENALASCPKKIQREWSCALCLISTTSEKCLKMHFQGKKHVLKVEVLRGVRQGPISGCKSSPKRKRTNGRVLLGNRISGCKSSPKRKRTNGRVLLGNFNQISRSNLEKWSGILRPIRLCRWKKPQVGWTKLNTDGSIDPGNAGFGGLFRNYKGEPICAFVCKALGGDTFLVELWAICRGLVLASSLGIKVIWVESDSMSVVKTINREWPCSMKASSCLNHTWELLKKFDKHCISHSWRETNRAADHLSKMVLSESNVVLWPGDFPDALNKIIKEDADGWIYCRS